MSNFVRAIELICKYEDFHEKACADPVTNAGPYTLGYGSQYYPDGSPIKAGQRCTKEKALEYLQHEVELINDDLNSLNLHLDDSMREALISFIHSIGWAPFLYSSIIDCIEYENWGGVTGEIFRWVYDHYHQVKGNLLERRREEVNLFLEDVDGFFIGTHSILLSAFRDYSGAAHEINAIYKLEAAINPYVIADFATDFLQANEGL
jgi:GH24 family phage-related lysozyme (muramidase)